YLFEQLRVGVEAYVDNTPVIDGYFLCCVSNKRENENLTTTLEANGIFAVYISRCSKRCAFYHNVYTWNRYAFGVSYPALDILGLGKRYKKGQQEWREPP